MGSAIEAVLFNQLLRETLAYNAGSISAGDRVTRNGRPVETGEVPLPGLTAIGDYRIFVRDEETGNACFAGQLWFGDEAAICAIRVKAAAGTIRECEIIRGPPRFPGVTGVDAATLGAVRPAMLAEVPPDRRISRNSIAGLSRGYYDAVNRAQPELAPLHPDGDRIEQGTRITNNPAFWFEFYAGLDGQALPNFGLWSAREQFARGMWNADRVLDIRFPCIEPRKGLACGFMTYRPWGKRAEVAIKGAGRVGPIGDPGRRVSLNAMEVFKVDQGQILEMETVWSIEDAEFRNSWASCGE